MTHARRDTDEDWKDVAQKDPYWGVLSEESYKQERMDADALAKFLASGERFVDDLFGFIKRYFGEDFVPKRCLDFGCGVGRLAIPLAKKSNETVGLDIAPAMLELCRKHAAEGGVTNLTLYESDDELNRAPGKFDLINTYIVLQHIPPERGYKIIQAMLSKLNVGGICSMQVTYAKSRSFLIHEQPKALFYRRDGSTITDILESGWSPPVGTINMFDYDMNQVIAQVTRVAGVPVLLLPTADDRHLGAHLIFQKARGE
jgi:2-polyprenyl-3-methyl-5-hydroxy-6-metoxy-1,4-benzoquinol methylase